MKTIHKIYMNSTIFKLSSFKRRRNECEWGHIKKRAANSGWEENSIEVKFFKVRKSCKYTNYYYFCSMIFDSEGKNEFCPFHLSWPLTFHTRRGSHLNKRKKHCSLSSHKFEWLEKGRLWFFVFFSQHNSITDEWI